MNFAKDENENFKFQIFDKAIHSNAYNFVKNETITMYHCQHRGQTSIKRIKHDFFEILAKMVNFAKDENENLNAKFLTGNASFLIPLKEA